MNPEEQDLILHAVKDIAESQRKEMEYRNQILDSLLKDLNVHIPERREYGDRRHCGKYY